MKLKLLMMTAIFTSSLSFAALAADGHEHATGEVSVTEHQHKEHVGDKEQGGNHQHAGHEDEKAHSDGHGHKDVEPHFSIVKPADANASIALLDGGLASAKKALEENDASGLHESSEKLETATHSLTEFSRDNAKLSQALTQLSKTVDRFHHAAEDGNVAGAKESLQILEGQTQVVKMLASAGAQ